MSIPTLTSDLLTPHHIRFIRGECGYCRATFIYVTKPEDQTLTQTVLEDAAENMKCMFSETVEGITFCPQCNLSIEPDAIESLNRKTPEYTVISDTLVEVTQITEGTSALAEVRGTVPIHHIGKLSVKFYRGSCYQCNEEFIYPESDELGDMKIPTKVISRLETNMGACWGTKAQHAAMRGEIWRCNNCRTLFFPSNKHCREQWGSLVPEYALLDDGYLYEVKVKTSKKERKKQEKGRRARRSSYTSTSSFSRWGNYDDYDYGSYGYSRYRSYGSSSSSYTTYVPEETMQEKLDKINDLIESHKDKRPRPSSAGIKK